MSMEMPSAQASWIHTMDFSEEKYVYTQVHIDPPFTGALFCLFNNIWSTEKHEIDAWFNWLSSLKNNQFCQPSYFSLALCFFCFF